MHKEENMKLYLGCLLILTTNFISFPQTEDNYKVLLLKEADGNIFFDTIFLKEGETQQISQSDFITFILPVGYGKSGEIIQDVHKNNIIKFSAGNGEISVSVLKADGSERNLPSIKVNDLKKYLIRVNVTGGNGIRQAFYIKNYNDFGEAEGPVFDLFGGKIPLSKNDYSITTEVTEKKKEEYISGSAQLEIYNNLLFVKGKINGGLEGYFIIDFGAGRTVLSKEFIPVKNKITTVEAIEYSSEGSKIVKGEMGAAGGNVSGFLGNTIIDQLNIGTLEIKDLSVSVLEKLPLIAGKKITGIIGMDILQKSPVVSIEYNYGNSKEIIFKADFETDNVYKSVTFSLPGNQVFINGEINDKQISFLFDTGARYSFISEGLNFKTTDNETENIRGLDGNIISVKSVDIEKFSLSNTEFEFKDFYSADLFVMNSMGLKDSGALLGGNFFIEFNTVTIDYRKKLIYFIK